jgi:hypothetical protein
MIKNAVANHAIAAPGQSMRELHTCGAGRTFSHVRHVALKGARR